MAGMVGLCLVASSMVSMWAAVDWQVVPQKGGDLLEV